MHSRHFLGQLFKIEILYMRFYFKYNRWINYLKTANNISFVNNFFIGVIVIVVIVMVVVVMMDAIQIKNHLKSHMCEIIEM